MNKNTRIQIILWAIVITTAIVALLFIAKELTTIRCPELYVFTDFSFSKIMFLIIILIIFFIIWLVGLILYLKFERVKRLNIILYFGLLATFSSIPLISNIYMNISDPDRQLKKEICEKLHDDGMNFQATKLTILEYRFLTQSNSWIPNVPDDSKEIDIEYYRDDFLGDYSLSIIFTLSNGSILDSTIYPNWKVIEVKSNGEIKYEYYENRP